MTDYDNFRDAAGFLDHKHIFAFASFLMQVLEFLTDFVVCILDATKT